MVPRSSRSERIKDGRWPPKRSRVCRCARRRGDGEPRSDCCTADHNVRRPEATRHCSRGASLVGRRTVGCRSGSPDRIATTELRERPTRTMPARIPAGGRVSFTMWTTHSRRALPPTSESMSGSPEAAARKHPGLTNSSPKLVGLEGFEPSASTSRTWRANQAALQPVCCVADSSLRWPRLAFPFRPPLPQRQLVRPHARCRRR
jgi:hypothetical protein